MTTRAVAASRGLALLLRRGLRRTIRAILETLEKLTGSKNLRGHALADWRLLETGLRSAAENIALDQALLDAVDSGLSPNTLRFLQFSEPCVLVGFNQAVSLEVREEYCRARGIGINRRVTGGGAIYCDPGQLGWEIVARKDTPGLPRRIEDLYAFLCEGAVRGLRALGVEAAFRPRNDLEVKGRKISGTGGTEGRRALLFQGTLLLDFDVETMARALRVPAEKLKAKEIDSIRDRVTCLRRELGEEPEVEDVKRALAGGVADALGVRLSPAGLSSREQELFRDRLSQISSAKWVHRTRKPSLHRTELRSVHKAPGGLIRVSLMADLPGERVRQILITGDFFSHPARAVLDLEASLKDCSYRASELQSTVRRFFASGNVVIPGCCPEDFCRAIEKALERIPYVQRGLTLDEANSIQAVAGGWGERQGRIPVLLPYCAKLPDCNWRDRDGCDGCGRCSAGDGYRIAWEMGCRPVSIHNYEELREVLERERAEGSPGFVGCCCDAFYAKHADDFEEIGLPGILIDIENTTCYDLGRMAEAKAGGYERQTRIKTALLEKVLALLPAIAPGREGSAPAGLREPAAGS